MKERGGFPATPDPTEDADVLHVVEVLDEELSLEDDDPDASGGSADDDEAVDERAKPKTSFATHSKIRDPDYPVKVA